MDTNQRINHLVSENEMLRNVNKGLASGRDMVVAAAKELGYQFSAEVSPIDYLIETARASVMVNQKNVELTAQCLAAHDAEVAANVVQPIYNKLKAAHGETTHPRAKEYLCEEAFELAESAVNHYSALINKATQ